MVLRPATSPRKIKLVDPEPARQDPETHLAGAFTPPGDLLRESVSRDWPLVYSELLAWCPEAEDRQGTPVLAALKTSEEVTSLPVPLRFWAETERSAHGKPLHPETPAGLAEQSSEGTEERRAQYNEVYTALPPDRNRKDRKHGHTPRSVPGGSGAFAFASSRADCAARLSNK